MNKYINYDPDSMYLREGMAFFKDKTPPEKTKTTSLRGNSDIVLVNKKVMFTRIREGFTQTHSLKNYLIYNESYIEMNPPTVKASAGDDSEEHF